MTSDKIQLIFKLQKINVRNRWLTDFLEFRTLCIGIYLIFVFCRLDFFIY